MAHALALRCTTPRWPGSSKAFPALIHLLNLVINLKVELDVFKQGIRELNSILAWTWAVHYCVSLSIALTH